MTIEEEDLPPRPYSLIESLRSFGYSPATAIADLIDNSIFAAATEINVQFEWNGPGSRVLVSDNGTGMDERVLSEAMRLGSDEPDNDRMVKDLGRFGLGLKTASFSQARSLTVLSKSTGITSVRRWDLDHVRRTNRWAVQKSPRESCDRGKLGREGTVVAWDALDRIVDGRPESDEDARRGFFRIVDDVHKHLEMVFHLFLQDGLSITVNGQKCIPWDPFMLDHGTEHHPSESLEVRAGCNIQLLRIEPYVLPHKSLLTPELHQRAAGPRGWNLQQGFYVYRAKRLIVPGDWFNPSMKPEEHHKLARIRIDITQEMDGAWALDVMKSKARPPAALRSEFDRIARATRKEAEAVYRSRGRREVGQGRRAVSVPLWLMSSDSEQNVTFKVNDEHLAVRALMDRLSVANQKRFLSILNMLAKNAPTAAILSIGYEDESRLNDELDSCQVSRSLGVELFDELVASGETACGAKEIILGQSPFCDDPVLRALLDERSSKSL